MTLSDVRLVAVALLLILLGGAMPSAQNGHDLFQQALSKERAEGKLEEAILLYQRIIKEARTDHGLAAKALVQMAKCYERLGKTEARKAYEQVVRDYPEQAAMVAEARRRLATLAPPAAGPFATRAMDQYFKGIRDPAISPDGRYAAYSRARLPRKGALETLQDEIQDMLAPQVLAVLDLTTSQERILADGKVALGMFDTPVWSPNGQQIAFVFRTMNPRDVWHSTTELRVANVATKDMRTLVRATDANEVGVSWSLDSQRLAFHVQSRPKTDDKAVATTDGIRIVDVASGESRALVIPPPQAGKGVTFLPSVTWTAKNEILFAQSIPSVGNDFFLAPADGGGPVRKVCEGRGASGGDTCDVLSQNGASYVRNHRDSSRLVIRDVASGVERLLTRGSGEEAVVKYSSDGRLLAFKSNRDGKWALYVVPLDRAPVATPIRIATPEAEPRGGTPRMWPGRWTSDGRLILRFTYQERNIYRLNVNPVNGRPAGLPERLTQDTPWNDRPAVSPDGQRIAYWYRGSTQKAGIAVMDSSGARERAVVDRTFTGPPELIWRSPDEVVFLEPGKETGKPALMSLSIKTGAVQPVPGLAGSDLRYVSAVNEIFYTEQPSDTAATTPSSTSPTIKARSVATGADRVVATLRDSMGGQVISPDGRSIAYLKSMVDLSFLSGLFNETAAPTGIDSLNRMVPAELRIMAVGGTGERTLLKFPAVPVIGMQLLSWSPDGKSLLYTDVRGKFRIVKVDSAESWSLFDETKAEPTLKWTSASWSADGSILLTGSVERAEWRQWSGLTYEAVTRLLARPAVK